MQTKILAGLLGIAIGFSASGSVVEFTSKPAWQQAVGAWDTITFTGWPQGTNVTTQYQGMGITFGGESYNYIRYSLSSFPNDGWGLTGAVTLGSAHVAMIFTSPQYYIAIDHPGFAQFQLFSGQELIYTSSVHFGSAYPIPHPFFGLVSTQVFDRAVLTDPAGPETGIDDLYWGPGVPAPGALGLLALTAMTQRKRRRT